MRFNAPPISHHRLQRAQRWMLLWLKWFAAFLAQHRSGPPASSRHHSLTTRQRRQLKQRAGWQPAVLDSAFEIIAHQWLDRIERLLGSIVMLRAACYVRPVITPKHAERRRLDTHLRRAVIGSAMRRALRCRDLHQRIAALSQDIDALVARLLKRLPRGLTRRRSYLTRPEMRSFARSAADVEVVRLVDTS